VSADTKPGDALDNLETRMRDVLLQLALTSNGRTVSYDSSGGGTPDYVLVDDRGRAKLAQGDAPHLSFAAAWDSARDDVERAAVLKAARDELAGILKSRADHEAVESKAERDQRIVKEGEGWPAREVATSFRCGIRDVWHARADAGRDVEYGELRRNGRALTADERAAEVRRMHSRGMSEQAIADALGIARGSVRFILARARARP
jgi:DNA-directed RNA polymerase specialized sigma24 family protein